LERLRVLTELQKNQLVSSEIAAFTTSEAKLTPAFADLFALTPTEQEALQRSIDTARDRLAELERENSTVSRTANGDVMIEVKPFPAAGGAVYDAVMKTFAETLNPERFSAFATLGAEQVEKALGRFGLPERKLVFSRKAGGSGDVSYTLRENYSTPREHSQYSSDFKTFEEMRAQTGTITHLLPADFMPLK
jgi:hypothetical protein